MNNKNNWTKTFDTMFPLDKTPKKGYSESGIVWENLNVFDDDLVANSAIDYLYSSDNRNKAQSFLQNNGFPSAQEREFNKKLYGVQEEQKNMQNLLKSKTNSILNPNLPNDTDRAFLKGLMGDKEEERDYQRQISVANNAQRGLQNAFKGTQFENSLKPSSPLISSLDDIRHITDETLIMPNEIEHVTLPGAHQEHDIAQYSDNKKFPSDIKDINYAKEPMHEHIDNNSLSMILPLHMLKPKSWNDICTQAKQAYKTFKNNVNETQKAVQRNVWKAGAQYYLRKEKEYYTSAWMLEHALQDNPSDIWRGNDSRIAYLINNDSVYLNALDEAIKNSKDGTIDTDLKNIQFDDDDLYYSIHKATIHVTGYKQSNGKWIVRATLSDKYDFTELMTFMDNGDKISPQASKGTIANDAAVVSQLLGAINPYNVTVDFYTTR